MKKRVRIYKAGGQSNAVSQEEVYKYIADEMSAEDYDGDTDAISEKLAKLGVDTQTADAYIDKVGTYLEENNSDEVVDDNKLTLEEQEAQQLALEKQYAAEEEARQAQLYAMYNTDTEEGVPDDNADEEIIMRYGGAKPSKRSFIKQYTKFAKMAQGGNTPSPGADDVLGGREQHVSNFFKGISESVNLAQQKQAAEEQYNAIYGNPQVGAYAQDGGIQQEQIDYENPMHHINAYAMGVHDIFQNNQNIQNDAVKQQFEQYGGFTDTDSGLYKFIGGGDNESMDEQYQDSDLNYQRYAKRGGALHKYVDKGEVGLYSPIDGHMYSDAEIAANQEQTDNTATSEDTEDWKKKYYDLNSQNTTVAQKQQQMLQQQMLQQYMQQMGNQMGNQGGIGKFRSPISRGMRYNQAVSDPYYTQSGEKYTGPGLAGRIPTSTDVTKYGIFGRPKQFTVNYGATPRISSFKAPIFTPGQNNTKISNTESDKQEANINNSRVNNRQPLANMMMKSGIPGIKQLGARMTRSGAIPEIPQGTQPTTPATSSTSNEPYYPPMSPRAQRRENRDDRQLNRFLGNNNFTNSNPESESINTPETQKQIDQEKTNPLTPVVSEKEPATSSQDEEFCYPGGMCFKMPEDQDLDSQLFNDLPRQLNVHSDKNNKNWLTGEGTNQQLDLSKLNKQDVIDTINSQRTGVNSPLYKNNANYNIDEYAQKWLKFQQDNQREFGNTNYNDLSDPYNIPEGESPGQKYAEWLNASGTADKENPYDIFKAKGMLRQIPAKEYGGPIDYTEYAYGGDVSIPELYKAQTGFETGADECPFGSTKDYKGDCVDFQGNITKKRNTNFKLSEPGELLKNPFSQPKKNPLTGEMSGIDNITSNANLEYKDDADVSQDFKNKQSWDIDGKALADDSLLAANALAQQFEMANANKQQNQLQANLTSAETNFGISNEDNSGDYDPNSGLFRPDKMGAMQSKYGGGVYAMGGNTEDEDEDVEYMTEDQIKRFLAEGGELEYV